MAASMTSAVREGTFTKRVIGIGGMRNRPGGGIAMPVGRWWAYAMVVAFAATDS
jgi:hypothetical protein